MHADDLILISVDDHLVEPPTMFDQHTPARWKDRFPEGRAQRRGRRRLDLRGRRHPQHRAQRRRRSPQGGVRHRADRVRRDAPRLLGRPRAGQGHERRRRPRLDELPVVPQLQRPAVRGQRRQGPRPRRGAGLQRLARRRVVRGLPGPLHPHGPAGAVGPPARGRRGPSPRRQGRATRSPSPRTRRPSATPASTPTTGIRSGRRCATTTWCCPSTSGPRASSPSPRPTRRST